MAAPKRTHAQRSATNQFRITNLLDVGGLRTEFEQLVADRCNLRTLVVLLKLLHSFRNADSWETLTGFRRRELDTVLKRMEQCAKDIERLNESGIAQLLLTNASESAQAHLFALPKALPLYADLVKNLTRERALQPRTKRHTNHVRAILTQYVLQMTGGPHDNEIARLLSVVLDRPNLTADSQKDWRREHRELLRTVHLFAASLANHRSLTAL